MNNKIVNSLTDTYGRVRLACINNAPKILTGLGIVGFIGTAVWTGVAAIKIKDSIDDHKFIVEAVSQNDEYTDENKEMIINRDKKRMVVSVIENVAGPVILGTGSAASIIWANNILNKRVATLASVCTTANRALREYRERVEKKYGTEEERKIFYNTHEEEVEETVVDKNGKEKKIKKKIEVSDTIDREMASRIFYEWSPLWSKDPQHNKWVLLNMQSRCNMDLRSKGWLSLNDVYEYLGEDPTEYGYTHGWTYDKNGSRPGHANYVDFGLGNLADNDTNAFWNGEKGEVKLVFNYDDEPIVSSRGWDRI